jgi:MHS family shikimate/dehydroshikimate transporter-like MFS transporter
MSSESLQTAKTTPMKKIVLVSMAGSAIEWYDFFVYAAAAALVFNKLFFPSVDPVSGTLLAFSTFAVGFLVRPIGAAIFGHFGDRFGRKPTLVAAMLLMGVATTAIGLLPTYATVGVLAPVLLVVIRMLQGLALGGQWGGAVLLATESAPARKRGFYGSFAQLGVPVALILSNVILLLMTTSLSKEAFLSWGWRVPFLLSIALIGFGLYAQSRIEDTPSMKNLQTSVPRTRSPFIELLRTHPKAIALAAGATVINGAAYYLLAVYMLSYATSVLGVPRNTVLTGVLISAVASGFAIPVFGALSDRIGRKKVFLSGATLLALWAFPLFWLVNTRSGILITVALVIGQVIFSMTYGPAPALFSEMFGTRVRYSGVSIGYQIGSVLGGAFAPIVATALYAAFHSSSMVSVYIVAVSVVSFISVFLVTETYKRNIDNQESHHGERHLQDSSTQVTADRLGSRPDEGDVITTRSAS